MTRAGDRNTESQGWGMGGRWGAPQHRLTVGGTEKRRDVFLLSGVFRGVMGAVKWGQPETSNMAGASGVARRGEDGGWEEWGWVKGRTKDGRDGVG